MAGFRIKANDRVPNGTKENARMANGSAVPAGLGCLVARGNPEAKALGYFQEARRAGIFGEGNFKADSSSMGATSPAGKYATPTGLDLFHDWVSTTMPRLRRWDADLNPDGLPAFSQRLCRKLPWVAAYPHIRRII